MYWKIMLPAIVIAVFVCCMACVVQYERNDIERIEKADRLHMIEPPVFEPANTTEVAHMANSGDEPVYMVVRYEVAESETGWETAAVFEVGTGQKLKIEVSE